MRALILALAIETLCVINALPFARIFFANVSFGKGSGLNSISIAKVVKDIVLQFFFRTFF